MILKFPINFFFIVFLIKKISIQILQTHSRVSVCATQIKLMENINHKRNEVEIMRSWTQTNDNNDNNKIKTN